MSMSPCPNNRYVSISQDPVMRLTQLLQAQQQQQPDDDLQSEHPSDSPPPQPLLRPAQGVWSAYNFPRATRQSESVSVSASASASTRPTTTTTTTITSSSSRLTHPESAQRHSQGGPTSSRDLHLDQHPSSSSVRRQSPASTVPPPTRSYNGNYYPNAAYTQQPSNTLSQNKNMSYYRSVSPATHDHHMSQRNTTSLETKDKEKERERERERGVEKERERNPHSQQYRNPPPPATSSHHHHHRQSPSPTVLSPDDNTNSPGNSGPRNQSSVPPPSPAPTSTAVHSGTSISQIIAATQSGPPASSSSASPVVRDAAAAARHSSPSSQQQQSSSPTPTSSRSSDLARKPGLPRPKTSSNIGTMYPFNSLSSVTARIPDVGLPNTADHVTETSVGANTNLPDPDAPPGAFANDPAMTSSSAVPDLTSPLLSYPAAATPMTEHHRAPQPHPHPQVTPQTLTPSLTPTLPPVQTQPPLSQGHPQVQVLTPTITPTSSVPPPNTQQSQIHAAPPSPSNHPQEIVVLLMEDIRFTGSEEPDFQLAEVSVGLREGTSSGSGEGSWWADGEEVIKALQMTTGRLEGSAKVYARRGKYRQCFVRIAEDGTMECQPMSLLMVSREKTIELIVESNFESRSPHDFYSYHRSHTPHHPVHPHPVAFSPHQPLHFHPRAIPPRIGMNMSMNPSAGPGPSGAVNMGNTMGIPYEEYYASPTSTHPHPSSYPVHLGHPLPPQSYYGGNGGAVGGGGGSASPTLGQKRNYEDDTPANKRMRTNGNGSGGGSGGANTTVGGNGSNFGIGGMVGVGMGMSNVSGMATPNPVMPGQGNSSSAVSGNNPAVLMEGVIPASSEPNPGGGGGNSSGPGGSSNPSSSLNRNRFGVGVGLSRPDSRGGNPTSGGGNNPSGSGSGGGGGGPSSGSGNIPNSGTSNPLSVNISGVRSNAPLGLSNVASGRLRGSATGGTSGSGGGGPGPSTSPTNNVSQQQQQQTTSPEEYTSASHLLPPIPSRMGNSTFVNHPGGKAPKEIINAAIVAYLRSHIQKEEGYLEFAASKGRLLPIPELLKGYRFAARIVATWANRKTPPTAEGCGNKRITKNHVLQALFRQTSWGSDCEQTLQLADKYGSGGQCEDSRVVEILNGGSMLPEKGSVGFGANNGTGGDGLSSSKAVPGRSQGSVALLDFLKDVDREYKSRGVAVKKSPVSSGGGSGGTAARVDGGGTAPPPTSTPSTGNGNVEIASGVSQARRTSIITGNPYPPVPSSSSIANSNSSSAGGDGVDDGGSGTGMSAPNPNFSGPPGSSTTQSLTPNATTPSTSPNMTHTVSPGVHSHPAGEIVQIQTQTVPSQTELVAAGALSDSGVIDEDAMQ